MSEPTGTYGIIPPAPRPPGRWRRFLRTVGMPAERALRLAGFGLLMWAAWSTGRNAGREEGARAALTTWGVQVEVGAPSTRLVGTGDALPAAAGPWKQVTLRYWVRRTDGAEPTDADVAASLREWCAVAPPAGP